MSTLLHAQGFPISYQTYWQLSKNPFEMSGGGVHFRSGPFSEAEARLRYLIDNHSPLAIVTGPAGSGKSTLLRDLSWQYQRRNHRVVMVNVLGLGNAELLEQLVVGLGGTVSSSLTPAAAWREIIARLRVNAFQDIGTAFFFDNADQAGSDIHTSILRIVHWGSAGQVATTVVLSAEFVTNGTWAAPFLNQCPLRVELEQWGYDDAAKYLASSCQQAGRVARIFDATAINALVRLSNGIPRRLIRIAEMALLAGAADQMEMIDEGTIELVAPELASDR